MSIRLSGFERANICAYVKDSVEKIPDNELNEIYNLIAITVKNKKTKNDVDRMSKIQMIESNLKYMDDNDIKSIEKITIDCFKIKAETEDEIKKRVALEIINKLLVALDKQPVQELIEFNGISRDDLLAEPCVRVIDENSDYIFKNKFNKHECNIYQKKNISNPHLSLIKGMLKQINYSLSSKLKSKNVKEGRTKYTTYYIKKKE
jgi:hypothetical protein